MLPTIWIQAIVYPLIGSLLNNVSSHELEQVLIAANANFLSQPPAAIHRNPSEEQATLLPSPSHMPPHAAPFETPSLQDSLASQLDMAWEDLAKANQPLVNARGSIRGFDHGDQGTTRYHEAVNLVSHQANTIGIPTHKPSFDDSQDGLTLIYQPCPQGIEIPSWHNFFSDWCLESPQMHAQLNSNGNEGYPMSYSSKLLDGNRYTGNKRPFFPNQTVRNPATKKVRLGRPPLGSYLPSEPYQVHDLERTFDSDLQTLTRRKLTDKAEIHNSENPSLEALLEMRSRTGYQNLAGRLNEIPDPKPQRSHDEYGYMLNQVEENREFLGRVAAKHGLPEDKSEANFGFSETTGATEPSNRECQRYGMENQPFDIHQSFIYNFDWKEPPCDSNQLTINGNLGSRSPMRSSIITLNQENTDEPDKVKMKGHIFQDTMPHGPFYADNPPHILHSSPPSLLSNSEKRHILNSENHISNFQVDINTLNCKEELSTWEKLVITQILSIATTPPNQLSEVGRNPLKTTADFLCIIHQVDHKVRLPEIRDHRGKMIHDARQTISILASHFHENQEFWLSYWSNALDRDLEIPTKQTQISQMNYEKRLFSFLFYVKMIDQIFPKLKHESKRIGKNDILNFAYGQFSNLEDKIRGSESLKKRKITDKIAGNFCESLWKMLHGWIEISGRQAWINHLIVNGKILNSAKFFFNLIFSHSIFHFENIIRASEGKKLN